MTHHQRNMKYQWYWKICNHYNTNRRHTIGENWNTKAMSKIPKPYEVIIIRTDDTPLVKNKIPMLWKKHYNTDRQNSTSETRNTNAMEKNTSITIQIDDTPPVQHEIQMTWVKYELR